MLLPESRRSSTEYSGQDYLVVYWMARLFKLLRDEKSGRIRIFQDLDEARRWLGLL